MSDTSILKEGTKCRRIAPAGGVALPKARAPYHDAQMAVDCEAASALGHYP